MFVDDDGFVRAPESRCYRTLTDVVSWPGFWPGTRVEEHDEDRYTLLAGSWPRRLRLEVTAGAWRLDAGFTFQLAGDVSGTWEIWLEPGWGGTVVHHVVPARAGSPRALPLLRGWLRAGLWGLKDLLEEDPVGEHRASGP